MISLFIYTHMQQIHIFMTCEKVNFISDIAQESNNSIEINFFFFLETDIVMHSFFKQTYKIR